MHLRDVIHQKSYEHIVLEVRRSPITLLPAIVVFLFLLALPIILQWFFLLLFPTLFNGAVVLPLATLFVSLYYLSMDFFFYNYFVDFYLDVLVVTNDRLIAVKQLGIFARTVLEVDLYQIQDATSDSNGTFASIFNYGNVTIETAGASAKVIAANVVNPHGLRRQILDLASVDKHYHQAGK